MQRVNTAAAIAQRAARGAEASPRSGAPAGAGHEDDGDATADDRDVALKVHGCHCEGRSRRMPTFKVLTKTIGAAVVLFTIGSVMLWLGVQTLPTDRDRAIGMLVVGCLAFLPGSYACVVLLGATLGWRGYEYDNLPSYDD